MNFIKMLNRENLYISKRVFEFSGLLAVRKLEKNAKFQQKHREMGFECRYKK